MCRWLLLLFLGGFSLAQSVQTPRQALLEIVKATSPEQVDKHTPDVLLKALQQLPPDMRQKQQQSMMLLSLALQLSNRVQTFETGPVLLGFDDPAQNTHVQIAVLRDDLVGDTDTMEFGIQLTKAGKEQPMPFNPRLLIDMKRERGIWKLSRLGGSASLQLDDPLAVEQIMTRIKEQASAPTPSTTPILADSAAAGTIAALRKLNAAEATYSATYPGVGFTCRLSDLGGSLGRGTPDEHGAQLIDPALESGVHNGYRIDLAGCQGSPSTRYRVTASPVQKGTGKRTYCTDPSGVVRSIEETASPECLTRGAPVH